MAHKRRGKLPLTPKKRKPRKSWGQKAAKIRKFETLPFSNRTNFDANQKKRIARLWEKYKSFSPKMLRKVTPKTRDDLAAKGFQVTRKGVILDAPRTPLGKRLKGARVSVLKNGIIKESVGDRRDYIIGLDKKQRRAFALDPKKFLKDLQDKTRSKNIKKFKKHYIRLQWGAFSGRIDYKIENLADYFLDDKGKLKRGLLKNLTGIRIITYDETKKRKKRKRGKGGKS